MKKWPIVMSLILTYVIFAILLNSVGTVILQVIHHFAVAKQNASVLEGFKDIPIAVVSFLLASLLPRFGYKQSLQVGLSLATLACVAMPILPGFLTTKFMFFAVGAGFALVKVSVYATIGLVTNDQNQHSSLLNTIEGFFMFGVLLGYWLFSLFITDAPFPNNDWLSIYWFISGLCVLNLIVLSFVDFPCPTYAIKHSSWRDFNKMLKLITQPLVLVFIASSFLYVLLEQGIGTWLPTFNHEVLQFPRSMSVQAASIFAGSLALGRLIAGVILQRVHWYTLLTICLAAMGALILLSLPLTREIRFVSQLNWHNAPLTLFLLPIIGLFMAPIYPAITSVMLSKLPKSQHAAMTGLIVVFSAAGGTTGSLITGRLFALFGGQTAFYLLLFPIGIMYGAFYGFRLFVLRAPVQTAENT